MDALLARTHKRLRNLLALEYNCAPEDFLRQENVLTVPALREGRRIYHEGLSCFRMVTTGGNAVVSAERELHPFLSVWMESK